MIYSSFAELGSAIPLSGGAQAYLAYAYHPIVSYLYAWTAISTLKPGGNAIVALIFGYVVRQSAETHNLMSAFSREYLNRLLYHATSAEAAPDEIPQWAIKLTASVAIVVITIICAASPKLATRVAMLFTSVKVRL
jgi:amino acid transporter